MWINKVKRIGKKYLREGFLVPTLATRGLHIAKQVQMIRYSLFVGLGVLAQHRIEEGCVGHTPLVRVQGVFGHDEVCVRPTFSQLLTGCCHGVQVGDIKRILELKNRRSSYCNIV